MLYDLVTQSLLVDSLQPPHVRHISPSKPLCSKLTSLSQGLRENIAVKLLAAYVAIGFIVMEILYFGVWCRPFSNYWALPTPNPQCDAATNHLITNAVFNISSDLIMLGIAFSLFARSRLPWNRKVILCGIFSLGIFVILAAILNKYYSFTHPFGSQWTYWYVRESSTAILVANLPFTWTLLRRIFNLKSFDSATSSEIPWHSSRSAMGRNPAVHSRRPARHQGSHTKTGKEATPPMTGPAYVTNGVPIKHGSHSSKASDTDDIEFGQLMPPPTALAAPETSMGRPALPPSYWRQQEVYGRADLEAMHDEPWDVGSEDASTQVCISQSARASQMPTVGTSKTTRPLSPVAEGRGRRIRGKEEMWKLQEGMKYHYKRDDENS
jgi:hypothetical protein